MRDGGHEKLNKKMYLNWRSTGVVCSVWLISGVCQTGQPSDVSFGSWTLSVANGIPNTSQPMSDQCKRGHEKDEDSSSVFWVTVNLSGNPNQPEQPRSLQQANERGGLWKGIHFITDSGNSISITVSNPYYKVLKTDYQPLWPSRL